MNKKLIIFDLDGTLFLTKESYRLILSELMSIKYNKSPEEILKLYNYSEASMDDSKEYEIAEDFFKEFNSVLLKKLGVNPTEKNLKELEEIVQEMKRRAPTELKMYPLAKEVLKEIKKKGHNIALLTGSWDKKIETFTDEYIQSKVERVDKLLKNSGIRDFFDQVFVAYVDKILKPNPEAFQKVLNHFNVESSEVIMIGDSEPDMKASDIGIKTILFDPKEEYSKETKPHYRFKDFSELIELINNID